MNQTSEIASQHAKSAATWGAYGLGALLQAIGITSWADASYFIAFALSACYLTEWWWKRMWRPLFVRFGWMKPLVAVKVLEADDGDRP